MSKLLINEPPILVSPSLALKIGLNEAIVLQIIKNKMIAKGNNYFDYKFRRMTAHFLSDEYSFLSPLQFYEAIESLIKRGIFKFSGDNLYIDEQEI